VFILLHFIFVIYQLFWPEIVSGADVIKIFQERPEFIGIVLESFGIPTRMLLKKAAGFTFI
jgi:hypothetical protein